MHAFVIQQDRTEFSIGNNPCNCFENNACEVFFDGDADYSDNVYNTSKGVRAACRLSDLKSDISQSQYVVGDVDGDGNVTAADARPALRRAVGLEDYAEKSPEFLACDADKDGSVTAADARLILRAAVGLEELK